MASQKMKTQFIVHCWLDAEKILGVSQKDFAIKLRSDAWVKQRIRIFKNFTLQSLLNQSFNDFRIFLFCGQQFRHITENFDFETDRVERMYDYGQRAYQEIEADHVSIMRIDSDDLFHRSMMEQIYKLVLDDRRFFSARWMIQWNIIHNFITDIKIIVSPFTNHLIPKKIYKNFDELNKRQFQGYRSAPELLEHQSVCIIRHKQNVMWSLHRIDPNSRNYLKREKAKRKYFVRNRREIVKILAKYGINEGQVPR